LIWDEVPTMVEIAKFDSRSKALRGHEYQSTKNDILYK
jgi:hypothetical protein